MIFRRQGDGRLRAAPGNIDPSPRGYWRWAALAAAGVLGGFAYRRWRQGIQEEQRLEEHLDELVDVASSDSMPASDPPAFTSGRARSF
jgi:hypothetical protein